MCGNSETSPSVHALLISSRVWPNVSAAERRRSARRDDWCERLRLSLPGPRFYPLNPSFRLPVLFLTHSSVLQHQVHERRQLRRGLVHVSEGLHGQPLWTT